MTAATFGDLLGPARDYLARAAGLPDSALSGESVSAAAGLAGRLASTLSRYLGDIAPYGMAEAITSRSLHPRMRAAVDAREALRMAAATLRATAVETDSPGVERPDPLADRLAAAADLLTAGRDLLRTHFAIGPDGGFLEQSDWSAVITSVPVTQVLAAEVASWSRQLAFLTTRLSLAAEADPAVPAAVRHGLAGGCHWMLTASAAITAGQRTDTTTVADADLLRAVPVNAARSRQPPGDAEAVGELAAEVAVSATRLRVVTWGTAEQAAWSPAMTAESWRWTATGAAVTCHISQLLLESLAERPELFAGAPEVALQLCSAAETAARACGRWREVASAWNEMTTETRGLAAPGITDTGDLIVRLGRLAFASPQWTPARARHSPLRDPADLAPGPAQFTAVVAAAHHAAGALASIAAADLRAAGIAVRASRLHVPTRTLPDEYDVPHRFANATPASSAALLDAYQAASAASDRAVMDLDALAVTINAPSRVLAFARAAIRPGPDASARRAADGSTATPASRATGLWDPGGLPPPGPAEQAVRRVGTPDVSLLLRAKAIDRATRSLIAEAKEHSRRLGIPGSAQGHGRPAPPARTTAQVAAENFGQGPAASMARRQTTDPRARTLPLGSAAVPGQAPLSGGQRHR